MPFGWVTSACALPGRSLHVALAIWDLVSLNKSPTIALTQKHLALFSVKRHTAYRALKHLEKAGLVTVERKPGRAPRVTVDKRYFADNRVLEGRHP